MILQYHERPVLKAPQEKAAYLNEALGDGDDLGVLLQALGRIADSRKGGIADLAQTSGLSRTNLYRILYDQKDVRSSTLIALLRALNLRISIEVGDQDNASIKYVQ